MAAVESRGRLRGDTAGPAAIHGQGPAGHRQAGAGHRDDDGPQEAGGRPVDPRPHHRLPGRPVAARTDPTSRERSYT